MCSRMRRAIVHAGRLVIAGIAKGPDVLSVGQCTRNSHGFIRMVFVHDAGDVAQCFLYGLDRVAGQTFAERHQKKGFTVSGAFAVGVMNVVDQVLHILSAAVPIANLAVVHEGPVFPNEGMAVASVHGGTSGGSDMRKKQFGLNMGSQALAHDGVLLMEDQIFKVDFRSGVGHPSTHKHLTFQIHFM